MDEREDEERSSRPSRISLRNILDKRILDRSNDDRRDLDLRGPRLRAGQRRPMRNADVDRSCGRSKRPFMDGMTDKDFYVERFLNRST